jgi:hypothetical protein
MNLKFNWYNWFHGLIAAVLTSASSGGLLIMTDPATFNFDAGFIRLLKVTGIFGLHGFLLYIKSYPTPAPWEAPKPLGEAAPPPAGS